MKKSVVALVVLLAVLFASCSTMVRIETPGVEGAEVILNGKPIGNTPVEVSLSDAVWETYKVEITKAGYQDYRGELNKEIKILPAIAGFFVTPIVWLWAYGPKAEQDFTLRAK